MAEISREKSIEVITKWIGCNEYDVEECVTSICDDCKCHYEEDEFKDSLKKAISDIQKVEALEKENAELRKNGDYMYQQGRADQLKEDCEITINLKGGVLADHDQQIRNEERERIIKELEVHSKYCREFDDIEDYIAVKNCIRILKGGAENEM